MELNRFPRRGYVRDPTPVVFLPRLSKALGGRNPIYIKRDDLLPGLAGGNKTRKLDYCFAKAVSEGANCIITGASTQSNHCRLTASWAGVEGMECHFVLEERIPKSYDPAATGNNALYHILGVKSYTIVPGGTDMQAALEKRAEELRKAGKKTYVIPVGASTPLGSLGYARCAEEILFQTWTQQIPLRHVIVASGSGGTHAGLVAGFAANNADINLLGMNVSRAKDVQEELIFSLANRTAELLQNPSIPKNKVTCFDEYFKPGYALPNDGMVEAVRLLARTEGILVDPVYSGKSLSGLIDLGRKGYFPQNEAVLFVHTGGSPAIYAYQSPFIEEA